MSWASDAGRRLVGTLTVAALLAVGGCGASSTDDGDRVRATPRDDAPGASSPSSSPGDAGPASPAPSGIGSPMPDAGQGDDIIELRIERRTGDDATAGFARDALQILTDPRGWGRTGFRFVEDEAATFLLVLAEGDEVDRLCEPYDTEGRYSCQNGPVVALNADRWRSATPAWADDLDGYRTYLVNHEVGHLLHLHHPSPQCPGPDLPAPVMLQQSTELGACTANPWPLPWEVDLAAQRREPLAPPADHEVDDHRPSPPPQQQDLDHQAVQSPDRRP